MPNLPTQQARLQKDSIPLFVRFASKAWCFEGKWSTPDTITFPAESERISWIWTSLNFDGYPLLLLFSATPKQAPSQQQALKFDHWTSAIPPHLNDVHQKGPQSKTIPMFWLPPPKKNRTKDNKNRKPCPCVCFHTPPPKKKKKGKKKENCSDRKRLGVQQGKGLAERPMAPPCGAARGRADLPLRAVDEFSGVGTRRTSRSTSSANFCQPFLVWEGSPTKIYYRKKKKKKKKKKRKKGGGGGNQEKKWYPYSNLSTGGPGHGNHKAPRSQKLGLRLLVHEDVHFFSKTGSPFFWSSWAPDDCSKAKSLICDLFRLCFIWLDMSSFAKSPRQFGKTSIWWQTTSSAGQLDQKVRALV